MVTSAYEMEWKDSEGQEKNLNLGINIAVLVAYVTRWLFSFITETTHTHEGPSRRRDVPQDDDYVFPEYPRDKFQGDSSGIGVERKTNSSVCLANFKVYPTSSSPPLLSSLPFFLVSGGRRILRRHPACQGVENLCSFIGHDLSRAFGTDVLSRIPP